MNHKKEDGRGICGTTKDMNHAKENEKKEEGDGGTVPLGQ